MPNFCRATSVKFPFFNQIKAYYNIKGIIIKANNPQKAWTTHQPFGRKWLNLEILHSILDFMAIKSGSL